jgi:hypothetical protein
MNLTLFCFLLCDITEFLCLYFFYRAEYFGLVRLAGGWWLRLIYCERKILLADWWPVAGAELV